MHTSTEATESSTRLLVRGDHIWTGTELLYDGAVLCVDGEIAAVGPWAELRRAHPDVDVVGGAGRIVMPGLINAHHHGNGITSFARGVLDDNLEPWLAALGSVGPAVDPHLDTMLAALDTMRGGYTTMVLFQSTANPDRALEEAVARIDACRAVGLRVAFGLDVMQRNFYVYGPDPDGLPARRGLTAADYIALLEQLRRRYASDSLVCVFAAPSGPEWVTDDTWGLVGEWSKHHRVPLHTHALESPLQAEYARRQYEDGLVAHLDRLGALHEYTSLVHGVYLNEGDFDRMAARGAHLITNPGSNLRLRCGVSPVLLALERGVNVALGTDGCSLGDRDDAWAELRLLFYLQRRAGIDTPALTWQQAVAMSTDAGARVTPWAGPGGIGAIAPGLRADLSIYDFDAVAGPWHHPQWHPVHVLLHRGGRQHLDAVVVDGRLMWDRKSGAQLVDEVELVRRVRDSIGAEWAPGPYLDFADAPSARPTLDAASHGPDQGPLREMVADYYRQWDVDGEHGTAGRRS